MTLPLDGRSTRVGLLRLWDLAEPFRMEVASAFVAVWPERGGEAGPGIHRLPRYRVPTKGIQIALDDVVGLAVVACHVIRVRCQLLKLRGFTLRWMTWR